MQKTEFRSYGTLFDSDGYYRAFSDRKTPPRVEIVLASTNPTRLRTLTTICETLGLPTTLKNISGPTVEEGTTPVERATHKNLYAARSLYIDGYFDRHPDTLVLLVAADSRNRYQGNYRDKPRSVGEFMQDGEELAKIAGGESQLIDETGYSILAIIGAKMYLSTMCDYVQSYPYGRHVVESVYQPDNYWQFRAFAHGFPSALMVRNDHVRVVSCSGTIICGQDAVDRTMGASKKHFGTLIQRAITTFAQ